MAEKTVVAKALEAFGQDMQQEAANELVRLQRQGFLPGLVAIILVAKTDLAVVDVEQAMVGDGHAVGITPQVIQDLFGTSERWFGVNHPLAFAQRGQVLGESFRVTESLEGGKELELAVVKGGLEVIEEQAPEQAREHADRQEEARTAADPVLTVRGDAAARHHAMQMGVEQAARTIP